MALQHRELDQPLAQEPAPRPTLMTNTAMHWETHEERSSATCPAFSREANMLSHSSMLRMHGATRAASSSTCADLRRPSARTLVTRSDGASAR